MDGMVKRLYTWARSPKIAAGVLIFFTVVGIAWARNYFVDSTGAITSTGLTVNGNADITGTVTCGAGCGGGAAYDTVQEEGTPLTQRDDINFIGSSITCVDNGGTTTTDCTLTDAVGYDTVQEEGSALAQQDTVNFIGSSITCVDNGGSSRTDCTVTSSGYDTIQEEGSGLTARDTLNFIGSTATCVDNSGSTRTDCTFTAASIDRTTTANFYDDFGSGLNTEGNIGSLGWSFAGGITAAGLDSVADHPGIIRLTNGAAVDIGRLFFHNNEPKLFLPAETFDFTFIFRLGQTANVTTRVGIFGAATSGNPPTDGIYIERLSTDTNWFAVTRASSSETRTDMSVAGSTSWFRFRIRRSDGSTIAFSIDGGGETDHTTNIMTAAAMPIVQMINLSGSGQTFDVDLFDLEITGMSR